MLNPTPSALSRSSFLSSTVTRTFNVNCLPVFTAFIFHSISDWAHHRGLDHQIYWRVMKKKTDYEAAVVKDCG